MNNLIAFILCILMVGQVHSQATFNKLYPLVYPAYAMSGFEVDGGYLIAGTEMDTSGGKYQSNLFTLNLDLEGNVIHSNLFSRIERDYHAGEKLHATLTDGRHVLALSDDSSGVENLVLVWMNDLGDTLRTKSYAYPSSHPIEVNSTFSPTALRIDASDNIYVCANIWQTETYDDGVLIKLNSEGDIEWLHFEEHLSDYELWSALRIDKTGLYLVGGTLGLTAFTSQIVKLDFSGNELWRVTLPNDCYDSKMISDIIVDGKELLLCGESVGGPIDETYDNRPVIFKVDTLGNTLWQQTFGQSYEFLQVFENLIPTCDGNFLAGAHFLEEELPEYDSLDGWRNESAYLVKINAQGSVLWDRKYMFLTSTQDHHRLYDLIGTSDGGFLLSGYVWDMSPSATIARGKTPWVVKTDACGCLVPGCDEEALCSCPETLLDVPQYFLLSSNLTSDFLNIYIGENHPSGSRFILYDALGNQVLSFEVGDFNTTYMISVNDLSAGSYILTLTHGKDILQVERCYRL